MRTGVGDRTVDDRYLSARCLFAAALHGRASSTSARRPPVRGRPPLPHDFGGGGFLGVGARSACTCTRRRGEKTRNILATLLDVGPRMGYRHGPTLALSGLGGRPSAPLSTKHQLRTAFCQCQTTQLQYPWIRRAVILSPSFHHLISPLVLGPTLDPSLSLPSVATSGSL